MKKETINIYSDKKFAAIFFVLLFAVSIFYSVSIWFDNSSLLIKLSVTLAGLLSIAFASFGIFTLFSKQFRYYGPETSEYIKNSYDEHIAFLIFEDRIQVRINPKKIVYYKDITSITVIPNALSEDEIMDDGELVSYTEIRYGADKKIVLTNDEYTFIELFQKNQNTTVRTRPTAKEVEEKFGKAKFIAGSFLFHASPVRINLWTKTSDPLSR